MVSILAIFFDILPVLTAAALSALSWAFFFLKPIYSLEVKNREDQFLLFMYFSIALIHMILTNRIKKSEKIIQERKEKDKIISLYNTLFNSLSHELKTPVSAILGATDVLSNADIHLEKSTQKLLINEISIASQRLNNQINNLLNSSRLESGELNLKLEWTHLEELIGHLLNQIDTKKQTHQIKIDLPENFPFFKLDGHLIEQAIYNLVINALTYTPEDSIIGIAFKYESRAKNSNSSILNILVSDNGGGIPENMLPQIFNKFFRVNTSKTGGSGLGLSIVKGIILAHGGSVEAKNNTFGGIDFKLTIPCEISFLSSK
jgi:two-component system sensor histidine kinase KdpD